MDELEEEIPSYKIVMLGASGVGKTSIINQYLRGTFDQDTLTTTGVCFNSKVLTYPEIDKSCKIDVKIFLKYFINIQLWDTAGQERYKSITKIYYQKSDSIIFVYDITNIRSYEYLQATYEEVKESSDITKTLVYIVGNKSDKYDVQQVKREEAEKYAKSINGNFRLVSALKSTGIKELFEEIGKTLIINDKKGPNNDNSNENNQEENKKKFELKKQKNDDAKLSKKKGCCK